MFIFVLPICLAQVLGRQHEYLWPFPGRFCYLWPFFMLGCILSKRGFKHQFINWKWIVSLPLYLLLFHGFQADWYVYRLPLLESVNDCCVVFYRFMVGVIGCALFLFMVKILSCESRKKSLSFLARLGKATLALYILQSFVFRFYAELKESMPPVNSYPIAIILTFIILYVLYGLYILIRKIPGVSLVLLGESVRIDPKS